MGSYNKTLDVKSKKKLTGRFMLVVGGISLLLLTACSNDGNSPKAEKYDDETPSLQTGLPSEVKGKLKIFLFVGQSQVSGRGLLLKKDKELNVNQNAFVFGNDYQWKIAMEPTDSPFNQVDKVSLDKDAGVGPVVSFTKSMNSLQPDWHIGIVQCAMGGTIIKQWQRDLSRDSLYGSCMHRAKQAQEEGDIIGIIFQQGESDAVKPGSRPVAPDQWGELFNDTITAMRDDLSIPDLPVIYTQVGQHGSDRFVNWDMIKTQQANANVANSAMVKTEDLPLKDYVHYTADGYRTLGERYAKTYASLVKK